MQVEFFLEMLERPNLCYFFKSRGFDDANYDIPIPCPMCQIPKFMDLVRSEFVIYAVEYPHLFLDTGCTICSICTLLAPGPCQISPLNVKCEKELRSVKCFTIRGKTLERPFNLIKSVLFPTYIGDKQVWTEIELFGQTFLPCPNLEIMKVKSVR